jgi:hypothetical protein
MADTHAQSGLGVDLTEPGLLPSLAERPRQQESAGATTSEVSFGSFRLLPARLLLLEGDKPVPLGSRALELLIVLLERSGELVTKQELMARVWPNLFVEPANLPSIFLHCAARCATGVMGIGSLSISLGAAIALLRRSRWARHMKIRRREW